MIGTSEGNSVLDAVRAARNIPETGAGSEVLLWDDQAVALVGNYIRSDPATTQPWATMLAENTPGAKPLGVPRFVAQGEAVTLVLLSATQEFVTHQCAAGEHVSSGHSPTPVTAR